MIAVTPAAARQVLEAARQSDAVGLALRIAARRNPDGSFHYAIGFDDVGGDNDQRFTSEGIELVVANSSLALVEQLTIDYVELEPGRFEFIFLNPADPNYHPPTGT